MRKFNSIVLVSCILFSNCGKLGPGSPSASESSSTADNVKKAEEAAERAEAIRKAQEKEAAERAAEAIRNAQEKEAAERAEAIRKVQEKEAAEKTEFLRKIKEQEAEREMAGVSDSGEKVFGECSVIGNMADFNATCTKDIKDIEMEGVTLGGNFNISKVGKKVSINITHRNAVKGYAYGYQQLDFKINHTDGSASNISVMKAADNAETIRQAQEREAAERAEAFRKAQEKEAKALKKAQEKEAKALRKAQEKEAAERAETLKVQEREAKKEIAGAHDGDDSISKECITTGNLADFNVICIKEIKNIRMGLMTAGRNLIISNQGKDVSIKIINSTTVKGNVYGYQELTFTINHTDGSASNITVKK